MKKWTKHNHNYVTSHSLTVQSLFLSHSLILTTSSQEVIRHRLPFVMSSHPVTVVHCRSYIEEITFSFLSHTSCLRLSTIYTLHRKEKVTKDSNFFLPSSSQLWFLSSSQSLNTPYGFFYQSKPPLTDSLPESLHTKLKTCYSSRVNSKPIISFWSNLPKPKKRLV